MKAAIFATMAAASLLLGGCATIQDDEFYPRLIRPASVGDPPNCFFAADGNLARNSQLRLLLNDASALQCEYEKGYRTTGKAQDWSQLPIVMLAAAAGIIGINGGPVAAEQIGKLGVVGLSYSSARGLAVPKDLPKAYVSGYHAISCVLARGPLFLGAVAEARAQQLEDAIVQNEEKVLVLIALLSKQPTGAASPEQVKALEATKTLSRQALATARTVREPAIADSYAIDGAYPYFLEALSSISVKVATTGRSRQDVSYNDLVSSFPKAPKPETTAKALDQSRELVGVSETYDVAALTSKLMAETEALLLDTSDLSALRPKLVEELAEVKKCPALLVI